MAREGGAEALIRWRLVPDPLPYGAIADRRAPDITVVVHRDALGMARAPMRVRVRNEIGHHTIGHAANSNATMRAGVVAVLPQNSLIPNIFSDHAITN